MSHTSDLSEVWPIVSRIPVLLDQMETGIHLVEETSAISHAGSSARHLYGKDVAKSVKKKSKSLEKTCQTFNNSQTIAISMAKETLLAHGIQLEEDSKLINTDVIARLDNLSQEHKKNKQKLESEYNERNKALEQQKHDLHKSRKECRKQWDKLQENMIALNEGRADLLSEKDPKRQSKLEKKVQKATKSITKSRDPVRKHFEDLEALVRESNLFQTAHLGKFCPDLAVRIKKTDIRRSEEVKETLKRFVEIHRESCTKMLKLLDHLDNTIDKMDPQTDASAFITLPQPKGNENPPGDFLSGLPCASNEVDEIINKILNGSYPRLALPEFGSQFGRSTSVSGSTPRVQTAKGSDSVPPPPPPVRNTPKSAISSPSPPIAPSVPRGPAPPARPRETKAVALYDLEKTPDNLGLAEGDVVVITDQSDDTWWGGYLENDPTKEENWFPRDYVDLV